MPAVVRKGDKCSGHGAFPPRPATGGSSNVFVNGKAVVRLDDTWATHTDGKSTHSGFTESASSTVFVNGKGMARKGDKVKSSKSGLDLCSSTCQEASGDVFAG